MLAFDSLKCALHLRPLEACVRLIWSFSKPSENKVAIIPVCSNQQLYVALSIEFALQDECRM
jgi:hypothetical protein